MAWIAFLVTVFLIVGLRRKETAGSRHLVILVVAALTLLVVYLQPAAPR